MGSSMWASRGRPGTCSTRDGPGVVGELCFAAGAIVLGRSRVITNVGHTLTYAGIERPTVDVDVHTTVGLDLTALPWLDFAVEIAFCVACWMYYRGSRKLLAAILALNIANLPLMLAGEGSASPMAQTHSSCQRSYCSPSWWLGA